MADILVHLSGSVEATLNRLVEIGFFKTKSEAVRAGILELGREYSVIKSREELLDELAAKKIQSIEEKIAKKKRRVLSENDVRKKYGF